MTSMLSDAATSVAWTFTIDGQTSTVTFNSNGSATFISDGPSSGGGGGGLQWEYSVGASGNPTYPLAFILQTKNPQAGYCFAQVYAGMCSTTAGTGFYTNGLPSGAPGGVGTFTMTPKKK